MNIEKIAHPRKPEKEFCPACGSVQLAYSELHVRCRRCKKAWKEVEINECFDDPAGWGWGFQEGENHETDL